MKRPFNPELITLGTLDFALLLKTLSHHWGSDPLKRSPTIHCESDCPAGDLFRKIMAIDVSLIENTMIDGISVEEADSNVVSLAQTLEDVVQIFYTAYYVGEDDDITIDRLTRFEPSSS